MQGDSCRSPGSDFRQEGMGQILVVVEALSDLDGQRAAQDRPHATHNLLYDPRLLQ